MIYADTSFLFSLVLHDTNTAAAIAYLSKHRQALALTPWQRCELHNAIRLAVFRGLCSEAAARQGFARIENDLAKGNLTETRITWPDVLERAESLSAQYTPSLGVRSLDLLHVAVATSLAARTFLTFDSRQLTLARSAGLRVAKLK